jgi:hypothetical protein
MDERTASIDNDGCLVHHHHTNYLNSNNPHPYDYYA